MSLISPLHNFKVEEEEVEADGDGEDGVHDLSKELVLYSCHITYVQLYIEASNRYPCHCTNPR